MKEAKTEYRGDRGRGWAGIRGKYLEGRKDTKRGLDQGGRGQTTEGRARRKEETGGERRGRTGRKDLEGRKETKVELNEIGGRQRTENGARRIEETGERRDRSGRQVLIEGEKR